MLDLDGGPMLLDQRAEAVDRTERSLDLQPAVLGNESGLVIGLEPPFGLVDASLEELLSLVQPRVAHLELAPA